MKKHTLKATSLRSLLAFFVLVTIVISAFGFYFAQDWLGELALKVKQVTSISTSGMSGSDSGSLQEELSSRQSVIDKVNSFTISEQDYISQVTNDLNKYASDSGISIKDFGAPEASQLSFSEAKSSRITITFNNPVQTKSLIQFLKSIESNLPKMQLTGINLSKGSTANTVSVDPLTIEVYIK